MRLAGVICVILFALGGCSRKMAAASAPMSTPGTVFNARSSSTLTGLAAENRGGGDEVGHVRR